MALFQHGKLVTIVPVAVVLMLLCAGAVQATTCPAGQKYCSGCVNPQTDVNNCGNCGVKCSPCGNGVPACNGGKCGFTCNAPFQNCDNNWSNGCESDSTKDVNNCGACGTKCTAPANASTKCYMGKCEHTCLPGFKNCDGKWENGCESESSKDANNCGACGTKCTAPANASTKCYMGKCEHTCLPGFKNCDGKWENGCESESSKDVNNCGACGTKCTAPPNASTKCNMGKCEHTCLPGFQNCDGKWENGCEVECNSNVNSCGACGVKCTAPPNASAKCYMGKCEYTCHPGYKNCDGKWENGCESAIDTDKNNCGNCNVKCKEVANAVSMCQAKKCVYICKSGWANCDNDWNNGCECYPETDYNHCGGCGKKCPEPKYNGGERRCSKGKCEENSCKKGMRYNNGKKSCEKGNWDDKDSKRGDGDKSGKKRGRNH